MLQDPIRRRTAHERSNGSIIAKCQDPRPFQIEWEKVRIPQPELIVLCPGFEGIAVKTVNCNDTNNLSLHNNTLMIFETLTLRLVHHL